MVVKTGDRNRLKKRGSVEGIRIFFLYEYDFLGNVQLTYTKI